MSYSYVPQKLRGKIEQQARHRCGYCLSPEELKGESMQVEHIIPEKLGGLTQENNLWLAYNMCK